MSSAQQLVAQFYENAKAFSYTFVVFDTNQVNAVFLIQLFLLVLLHTNEN